MSLMPRSRLTCDSTRSPSVPVTERHTHPRRLVEQERHGQHRGGGAEDQRTGQTLPRFLRADRRSHRVLAEQHARRIAANIGEHHTEHQAQNPPAAVVGIDQQHTERTEQRDPRGQEDRHCDVAQIVDGRLCEAAAEQPPDQAQHDGATERPQRTGRAERPGQPDHRLPAQQKRYHRDGVAALPQPTHDLVGGDRHRDRHETDPDAGYEHQDGDDAEPEERADGDRCGQVAPGARRLFLRRFVDRLFCHGSRLLIGHIRPPAARLLCSSPGRRSAPCRSRWTWRVPSRRGRPRPRRPRRPS